MRNIRRLPQNADDICRGRYDFLYRESVQNGLNLDEIEKSVNLCHRVGKQFFLQDIACKPTGVALGCPLPDSQLTEKLWRLIERLNNDIALHFPTVSEAFSFVKSDTYHITIVNRSHYKTNSSITEMTMEEKKKVVAAVSQLGKNVVRVHLQGLILTSYGRLIIKGFPEGDNLYRLRNKLVNLIPELRVNIPNIAHIKLGHLLAPFNKIETEWLMKSITEYGKDIDEILTFTDVYTPVGRISLLNMI